MGSFPPTPEPTTDPSLATTEPTDPSLVITEPTDASPPFSFATSEPTEPSPPISFAIWSRRPRDPSHAPGIIISPRACPPPKVVDEALDSKTPPISPRAAKKKLPSAVESRDTTTLRLDAVPHSQTSSTVPSSAVTESADTPTIPGSPATTNTSISTEAKPEVTPTPASENDSSAPSDEKKADDEAPSVPVPEPAAAPAVPPVKKSWASLLRPASSSASPGSSAKNALPTSSIVGFSIPADAPSAPPAQSVSPSRNTELLNLLMSPPSTAAFAPRIRPRGLVNSGNMCFANAVLQILVYCPPFHRLFVELGKVLPSVAVAGEREREKEREKDSTPLVDATALFLKEFLEKRKQKQKENGGFSRAGKGKERELLADDADDDWDTVDSFLPTYIYDAMKEKKRFDTMRGGQQEDAEEFLGFYLDTLEEELLLLLNSVAKSEASGEETGGEEKKEEGWMEVGKKNRMVVTRTVKASESPITRIFGGKFRSTLHAPRQKDSAVVEDWRSLRLDIQPDNIHTIQDALAYISHPQHVQLNIPTQPVAVEATQVVSIESLPPILVLHIKRFEYDVKVGGVVKVGKQVRFDEELSIGGDLMAPAAKKTTGGPTRYKLFGVLYHHGLSASGGHYTLDVLHPNRYASLAPREGWIRIDDDLVSDVRREDVFGASLQERDESRCAYLLFYRRL
ncbi:cysteine proteinase [Coprinellus micaceus]|uniref:Ubiquitin carboxyl-terminal hydrolase n=1 Tax=Coprinellus micaceus TaxID=71717 RepID=A0A4Y7TZC4_COPMI|nr:cysteine proteinase [Coprinellus micaceus]